MALYDVTLVTPTGRRIVSPRAFDVLGAPEWPPPLPAAPDAARIAQIKLGAGYPERRKFFSFQWHDSEHLDIDHMRHVHLETAVAEEIPPSLYSYDALTRYFHFQGGSWQGIRKFLIRRAETAPKWSPPYPPESTKPDDMGSDNVLIPQGAEGHDLYLWKPIFFDLRQVPPSWYRFELDNQTIRPDGMTTQVRGLWTTWIDSARVRSPQATDGYCGVEGWVSPRGAGTQFGYLAVFARGARFFTSDPERPIKIQVQALIGMDVLIEVFKNPDLHTHPPFYGEPLFWPGTNDPLRWTHTQPLDNRNFEITIPAIPNLVAKDRILIRAVSASDPVIGAGASLLGWTLLDDSHWLEVA